MSIGVENIVKRFGNFPALHGVSLQAQEGEFLALLGPSGSGKTTLLRIMAGLEFPDEGRVLFEGEDVTGLGVKERAVGFVFQHYALFKHMTVLDNIAFGLSVKKRRERPSRADIADKARELLDLVQLGELGSRYPAQLSGGQRQRVALARALAVDPKLLLLDEPFGALDAKVRKELRSWLRGLHDRMGITSVFVTHDQEEALELADRVVVMDHGVIGQVATPQQVYEEPASAFVFDFVGESISVPVMVASGQVLFEGRPIELPVRPTFEGSGSLYFRPHDVRVGDAGGLPFKVRQVRRRGGVTRIEGCIFEAGSPVEIILRDEAAPAAGSSVSLHPTRASVFPIRGEREATTIGEVKSLPLPGSPQASGDGLASMSLAARTRLAPS